ncbi:MAG: YdeI/OmpD-associated family protein [Dongiaceae bacterium]
MSAPRFFASQKAFRTWLEKNHASAKELVVGLHKVKSGKGGLAHKQAIDEALCFGWIDGVGKGGDTSWAIRFSPRKARSIWSQVNIRRIEELKAAGLVHPAGLAAYERRTEKLQNRYSHENPDVALSAAYEKAFRANRTAWANFGKMPPSYRRPAIWWVMSAKQETTRERRLKTLIADSAAGRRVRHLTSPTRR